MTAPPQATLLVVDDNEDNRYTLTRRLRREGYTQVLTADDGRQALELLNGRHVDLMLLDIMMPGMDGYQVLERVKADATLREIPVIMISALEEVESVIRCVELGAEDYLPKPFNPTLLRARVGACLEKKRLRDAVRASLERLERELDEARALQLGMLPSAFPAVSQERPLQVHALMDPAREVGGDLYDAFYAADGTFCFLVGDVSGKGAAAAMFMARTRSLVRLAVMELLPRLARAERLPSLVAEAVNRELFQDNRARMFVTLFLGFLDVRSGSLTYVNAGHPAPYLMRGSGRMERIDGRPQAPLAVRATTRYLDQTVAVHCGDALFACSDGVVEAVNEAGQLYSGQRLESQLRAALHASPEALVHAVKGDVDAFAGETPKADDVTLLAVRWPPAATELVVLRNDPAELGALHDVLARIGAAHGLAARSLNQLQVGLDEMVSNAIKYAWPEGGAHEVRVRITVSPTQADVEIEDDGRAFDPLAAPAPPVHAPGARPAPGGLGIHMVKKMMDHLEYARVDGRNRLRMRLALAP